MRTQCLSCQWSNQRNTSDCGLDHQAAPLIQMQEPRNCTQDAQSSYIVPKSEMVSRDMDLARKDHSQSQRTLSWLQTVVLDGGQSALTRLSRLRQQQVWSTKEDEALLAAYCACRQHTDLIPMMYRLISVRVMFLTWKYCSPYAAARRLYALNYGIPTADRRTMEDATRRVMGRDANHPSRWFIADKSYECSALRSGREEIPRTTRSAR